MHKEERDALEEKRKTKCCETEKFGTLDSSEKTIAILGDTWWPQTKQEGNKISKIYIICHVCKKKRNERSNVRGVSNRSRNGVPSRKECVVNGRITYNASNKRVPSPPTAGEVEDVAK